MNTLLREYEDQAVKAGQEQWLGRLLWYWVNGDLRVPHADVQSQLEAAGLTDQIPSYPKDHDVFRRVTSDAQRRNVPVPGQPDQHENYLLRDVSRAGESEIVRRVVVERKAAGRRLSYDQVCDVIFKRSRSSVSFDWINGYDEHSHPTAALVLSDIQRQFKQWRGCLNDQAIREWIRRTVLSYSATPVRPSGGVYFLREDHADKVAALEQFVDSLPGDNEFHSLPLIDTGKQRDMIRKAFEAETNGAIDELLTECREIRTAGEQIQARRYTRILKAQKELRSRTEEYADLLEGELRGLNTRLKLLNGEVGRLARFKRGNREEE